MRCALGFDWTARAAQQGGQRAALDGSRLQRQLV